MLISHADGAGYCFPGIETLALECAIGRTAVVGALDELQRGGWLTRERRGRAGGTGGRTSNGYHLSPPRELKLVESAPRSKGGELSPPSEGVKSAARGGFRPPHGMEAGQGSRTLEASPKAPAGGGSGRSSKTTFPEGFAPDAEGLALAHKRGVDAATAVSVLREQATANGWRKACWQAAFRAHLLTLPDRPSGVRRTEDPEERRRRRNAIGSDVESGFYGPALAARLKAADGPASAALLDEVERGEHPKRKLGLALP